MFGKWNRDTHDERIDLDLNWIKDLLRDLTTEQRCLILEEYTVLVKEYNIGMKEYKAFVKAFDELED